MSYDDAEARVLTGFNHNFEPSRPKPPLIDHEWWATEPSPSYIWRRVDEKSKYYRQVRASVSRPNYGGYRIEFRGIRK